MYYSNFLFFRSHAPLGDLLTLSKLFWKALLAKKKLRTPAFTGCNPVQEKSGMREVTFSYRVDVFFRLLVPAALFVTVFKSHRPVFLNTYTYLIIPPPLIFLTTLILIGPNPLSNYFLELTFLTAAILMLFSSFSSSVLFLIILSELS